MTFFRCQPALTLAIWLSVTTYGTSFETTVSAQAPAVGTPSTGTGPGSGAPAGSGPAPGISGGTPRPGPPRPLTLSDVVTIAVGGNSGLVLAQQRLQKAQELIAQVNAQARPQFRADAADTYSSYRAFAPTLANPTITNPTLPGGGQIPVVVDNGTSFSTAFVGGGGGGTAPSSGTGSASVGPGAATTSGGVAVPSGSGTVAPTGGPAAPAGGTSPAAPGTAAPSSPAPSTNTPAAPSTNAPATPSTNAPSMNAPATPNTNAPAAPGTGGATGSALPALTSAYVTDWTAGMPDSSMAEMPSHASQMAETVPLKPRDTTTGTGDGGGTTTTTTTATGGGAVGQRNTAAARVSVSQYLDLFGLLSAARGAQNDVRDFYAQDIERLRNEIALAAKNLFFNVLLTQEQVATQQEQVRYATEDVRITQERLKQGIVSRFDVLTAETALSTAQQQLISAEDSRDLAQANLSYLLGTDPNQPVVLAAPGLPPLNQTVDLTQSTQTALTHRPEVRQAGSNIEEARRLVKLAGSTLLPTVGLVASGEQASLASTTTPRSYASITAQVAVPLDDGGATRSRVRSAQIDVQTQALTLEQLKLTVSLEVRQAILNIRNAQAQVGAAQTGVAQAEEALRLAYLRYQGGLGTFLDVLNALAQLARTRDNLSSADYFYQTSLAQLVRATGGR